ncbi:LysR family transcriptional regulator, partial [Pseudomonas frederiksbergensis]|nr:LysR family transcriptional regulator [Pseudomonas frederiksbergensis]
KGMRGAALSGWIDLQQGETVAQAPGLAVSA